MSAQIDWLKKHMNRCQSDWVQIRSAVEQILNQLPDLNRRQENWRYSRIESLFKQDWPLARPTEVDIELPPAHAEHRLVFIDGRFSPRYSQMIKLPANCFVGSLAQAKSEQWIAIEKIAQIAPLDHLLIALNSAMIQDGALIHLAEGVDLGRLEIICIQTQPALIQPRHLIWLEKGARLELIEQYLSQNGGHYFNNGLTEIQLEDHAQLNHYRLQDEDKKAWHFSSIHVQQFGHSHYQSVSLAFGSAWGRTDYRTRFEQPEADCVLRGLYLAGNEQWIDFHLDVHHAVPHCRSIEQFKGILYDQGRAIFDGRILVDKQAQKSDARLSNDNLMLSRQAEIDTKPQLEIYADDVQCSHGTTVGQLDPQHLFYLRSRGIDQQRALQILSIGFAETVIEQIPIPSLKEQANQRLESILAHK